jgi:hypothetical protein
VNEKQKIILSELGTVFKVGPMNAEIELTDENCIWRLNGEIHFTPKGWSDHQKKKDGLSKAINEMRNFQ